MKNFLTRWYPLLAVVALLLLIVTVSGCAAYRDGRSLICMGWCWQVEGHTEFEKKAPNERNAPTEAK
jgi:uncharacterized membrane protein YGL010W